MPPRRPEHFPGRLRRKRQTQRKTYPSRPVLWLRLLAKASFKGQSNPDNLLFCSFLSDLRLMSPRNVKKNTWFQETPLWVQLSGRTLALAVWGCLGNKTWWTYSQHVPVLFLPFPFMGLHLENKVKNTSLRPMTTVSLSLWRKFFQNLTLETKSWRILIRWEIHGYQNK